MLTIPGKFRPPRLRGWYRASARRGGQTPPPGHRGQVPAGRQPAPGGRRAHSPRGRSCPLLQRVSDLPESGVQLQEVSPAEGPGKKPCMLRRAGQELQPSGLSRGHRPMPCSSFAPFVCPDPTPQLLRPKRSLCLLFLQVVHFWAQRTRAENSWWHILPRGQGARRGAAESSLSL